MKLFARGTRDRCTRARLLSLLLLMLAAVASDVRAQVANERNPGSIAQVEPRTARAEDRNAAVLSAILGDRLLAADVHRTRDRAATLAPDDRFEFLAAWVLPNATHPGIRLAGAFTQTDPPPNGPQPGGEIVSPVFDLLDVAREMGQLQDLRGRIAAISDGGEEYRQRAKAALELLIGLELDDRELAAEAAQRLQTLALTATPQTVSDMWPETLAIYRAVLRFEGAAEIGDLVSGIYLRRIRLSEPRGCPHWHSHLASLMHRYQQAVAGVSPQSLNAPWELDMWIPTSRAHSQARGHGSPPAQWIHFDEGEVRHVVGHDVDYVFYRSPLRGNFEIEGDLGAEGTTQVLAAGKYFGPRVKTSLLETGTFRAGPVFENLQPPLTGFDAWVRFRAVFRNGLRRVYLNGRLVHSESLPEHHDPWLAVRSWGNAPGRFRGLQIHGEPQIPDAVLLSASQRLDGWAPYFEESAGFPGAIWQHDGGSAELGEIRARRLREYAGMLPESLLRYQRPLVNGESVEYEFFYERGQVETHPALDRLAFLLDPAGVRIHWITDGRFDTTELPLDNRFDEPQNRRGPDKLPLMDGAWNRMHVALLADTLTLRLNDQVIYERPLETNNRRTFGFFRHADQSEVRVRNVVLKGDWPQQLARPAEQDFADELVASLDESRDQLPAVFVHDFAKDGIPDEYFRPERNRQSGEIIPGSDGVLMVRPSAGPWSVVGAKLRFAAVGDFDFEAVYEQFQAESEQQAAIMLLTRLEDAQQRRCRLSRILNLQQRQQLNAALSILHPDGSVTFDAQRSFCEANAGRLRLVRRGQKIYYLFAENNSPAFRCLRVEEVSAEPTVPEGISLLVDCNGVGMTRVLWKKIILRAEELRPSQE